MITGGQIIEVQDMDHPETGEPVTRFWAINGFEETVVYARPQRSMPGLHDAILWTNDRIVFDRGQQSMEKVGKAEDAPCVQALP